MTPSDGRPSETVEQAGSATGAASRATEKAAATAPFEGLVERLREGDTGEVTSALREAWRLGDAMRAVIERLVATSAPPEVLAVAASQLEGLAAILVSHPRSREYNGYAESANSGDPRAFFEWSPLLGRSNPLAPPISVRLIDGQVFGTVRFGSAYEGPPGCVHGGYIAAGFDEVLSLAQSMSGERGMTANLTVDYRQPTPLHRDVRFVGDLVGIDGRKITTRGQLWTGDVMTAEAQALFIAFDAAKFNRMIEQRRSRF